MTDVCHSIHTFNQHREPERLAMKYRNMRTSPFVFFRASCHLFYERFSTQVTVDASPLVWSVGDLHLENFGSYKGDNRLAYFDLNDFDEAVLAPPEWDIVRFISSLRVGAKSMGIGSEDADTLVSDFLKKYQSILAKGKSHWIERETSTGLIRNLLTSLKYRKRSDFLDKRTLFKADQRRLRIDGEKALKASPQQQTLVKKFLREFAKTQPDKKFFQPLDIARRVAGNGSLGIERYIILVNGKGNPDGNYLLDLKEATPSSLLPFLPVSQPTWDSEAHRVVTLQNRMQAVSMAFLQPVTIGEKSYVLRALQPSEDRVLLDHSISTLKELKGVIETMAVTIASAQLRSSGRQGSANADELVQFAFQKNWIKKMMAASRESAKQVNKDWKLFCAAYDDGDFKC
ncbi:DUF2252 domain-containing protein [Undibacterium sp. SXout7W]|uniref:DUF2252 domain-containing protein n=1 Tax=Undibacterium sp. SXout7W TaxID=3413049 RepID=UPI003BEFF964